MFMNLFRIGVTMLTHKYLHAFLFLEQDRVCIFALYTPSLT